MSVYSILDPYTTRGKHHAMQPKKYSATQTSFTLYMQHLQLYIQQKVIKTIWFNKLNSIFNELV